MATRPLTIGAGMLVGTLAAAAYACSSRPASGPAPDRSPAASDLTPAVTVRELMQDVIEPGAHGIFDAVSVTVTKEGVIEERPTTDEEWAVVERAAVMLAEASNLLKIPRGIAPSSGKEPPEPGAPELTPAQIQERVDADRALWNRHADALRVEALAVLDIVRARDSDRLLQAGSDLDAACEECHLEYWYPGDRAAVLRQRGSRVFHEPVDK